MLTTATVSNETPMLAPHSQEAEEAVLGSCLINPNIFPEVIKFLKPDDFFILRNGWVFEAMQRLSQRHEPIEYLTVIEELRVQDRLSDIGGAAYITYLVGNTGTTMNGATYGWIVSRTAYRRRALELADEISALSRNEGQPFNIIMPQIVDKTTTLANAFAKTHRVLAGSPQASFVSMIQDFETFLDSSEPEKPIPTGIQAVDTLLNGGLFPGWLIVFASRMKVGKTRMKVTLALNAAKKGHKVAFYTTEERRDGIMRKMITILTGISDIRLRLKQFSPQERDAVRLAAEFLKRLNIQIYDASGWTVPMLRDHYLSDHLPEYDKADVVFVDYIQRLEEHRRGYAEKEHSIYGKIAQDLKNMANDLSVLVITSSQYNREGANGKGENSTLAGSDQIAREADLVVGIDRPETYETIESKKRVGEVDLKITAARHDDLTGKTVTIGFNRKGGWFCDPAQRDLEPMMLQNARNRAARTAAPLAAVGATL